MNVQQLQTLENSEFKGKWVLIHKCTEVQVYCDILMTDDLTVDVQRSTRSENVCNVIIFNLSLIVYLRLFCFVMSSVLQKILTCHSYMLATLHRGRVVCTLHRSVYHSVDRRPSTLTFTVHSRTTGSHPEMFCGHSANHCTRVPPEHQTKVQVTKLILAEVH